MSIRQHARAGFLVALVVIGLELFLPLVPLAHADHPGEPSARCATCLELALCQAAPVAAPPPAVPAPAPGHAAPPPACAACAAAPAVALAPARAPPSALA